MENKFQVCGHCREPKSIEYYNPSSRGRVNSWCRECRRANLRRYKNYFREYQRGRRDSHYAARYVLSNAVRRGEIIKPNTCQKCGATSVPIEAHHTDYNKPLEVEWLCRLCHGGVKRD